MRIYGWAKPKTQLCPRRRQHKSFLIDVPSRLEGYRKHYDHGVIVALYAALKLIIRSGYLAPDWVLKAAKIVVGERILKASSISAGGPGANELSDYQNRMRDFRRWLLVKKVMEKEGVRRHQLLRG